MQLIDQLYDVSLPRGIVLQRMAVLSGTGFSLCTVNGPQLKPQRIKPVLQDRAGLASSLLVVKPAESFHEIPLRYAGELPDHRWAPEVLPPMCTSWVTSG